MVLIAAASHPAKIELRSDNIQVVNTFNDGRRKYVRDWLKRTDHDVASLAWSLAEERERRGFGGLEPSTSRRTPRIGRSGRSSLTTRK
jgi:hypothetical protein